MNLPLVVFGVAGVEALLDSFAHDVRLARFQRMAEDSDDFIRVGLGPQRVDDLFKVSPDYVSDFSKDRLRSWIDLADAKIRIDHIDANRRLIDERLVLRRAMHYGRFRLSSLDQIGRLTRENVQQTQIPFSWLV